MKTALTQLIDIMKNQINNLSKEEPTYRIEGALFALKNRLIDAEELLEAEKEQIIEAYTIGHSMHDSNDEESAEDYYTQTFKLVE